ncbi:MAG: sulfate/thiosulfate transport system permease protein [Solirubrobacterales bacterium]|jgi:sulfate transport system permease protein|nr:sulfate/thiosulfate transport system permease protein [Solirubrobacterales bacterium]
MSALSRRSRWGLRSVALIYLAALLMVPVGMIFYRAFEHGLSAPIDAVTSANGLHAFWLTILCVGIAVPLNTLFGVVTALVLVRQNFRGKALLNAAIDLPFAISPVVIGLALFLVYAPRNSWFGGWLMNNGIQVIFSVPGMILATIFVSLPFVVREVMPVLQEIGMDQEEAAETLGASPWQTFWKVTLPAIRWGVTYGVVLATARALGEFGAVSVVAGNISGTGGTQTLPLYVKNQFDNFNLAGAYGAAIVLAILAIAVLFGMNLLQRRSRSAEGGEDEHELPGPGVFVPQPVKEA